MSRRFCSTSITPLSPRCAIEFDRRGGSANDNGRATLSAATGADRRKRLLLLLALPLLVLLGALGYREFVYDPYPAEAIAFFFPVEAIDDDENAIFSIAGLAAPLASENSRDWGYRQIRQNWRRRELGEVELPILSRWDLSKDYPRLLGFQKKKIHCWLPEAVLSGADSDCYTRAELEALVDANRALLDRYEAMFDYGRIDNRRYYGVNLAEVFDYSELYALQFWLRREQLGATDYSRIFRFFRFWEKLYAQGAVGTTSRILLMFNYRKASNLISGIAQYDPGILLQYQREYGNFEAPIEAQAFLDQALRQEFYSLDRYLCLRGYFELAEDCAVAELKFPGKFGELTRNVHARRPLAADCPQELTEEDKVVKKPGFWRLLLRDPGNISGNILLMTVAQKSDLCKLLRFYQLEAEASIFRNHYLDWRESGFGAAQWQAQRAPAGLIFDNPFSGNRMFWDPPSGPIRWQNTRFEKNYSITP